MLSKEMRYIRIYDQIREFALNCLEESQDALILKETLYAAFVEYCQKMRLRPLPIEAITRRLGNYVLCSIEQHIESRIKFTYWRGIKLRKDAQNGTE